MLTERQRIMLDVLSRDPTEGIPVGLSDLCDKEFCELIDAEFVDLGRSMVGIFARITDAGRAALREKE